ALEKAITPATCAILCEPLQGESGVRPLRREYLRGIRRLCDQHHLLLIFDEIQVGMGRTGSLFAYEQLGVTPDIMTLAKAIGNGLPLGAMLTTNKIAAAFTPGSHASTFGGNPVACAAGVAVMETMLKPGFFDQVNKTGKYLSAGLAALTEQFPHLAAGVRGAGLIQALILTPAGCEQGVDMVNKLFRRGILANFAGSRVLRFIPPLIVSEAEIDKMLTVLNQVLKETKTD
ncbi:Acetylornithine aminotransferase, partial [hydrothermal vent metagenome]